MSLQVSGVCGSPVLCQVLVRVATPASFLNMILYVKHKMLTYTIKIHNNYFVHLNKDFGFMLNITIFNKITKVCVGVGQLLKLKCYYIEDNIQCRFL